MMVDEDESDDFLGSGFFVQSRQTATSWHKQNVK
jgi:hypothetical protein